MPHSLDFNIRERLADYLADRLSLREFVDWFYAETWDVDDAENQTLTNLVYEIKLRLAEYSHGDWTEAELHSMLLSILEKHVIEVGDATFLRQPQVTFGTTSSNYSGQMPIIYSGRHVDISPSAVRV